MVTLACKKLARNPKSMNHYVLSCGSGAFLALKINSESSHVSCEELQYNEKF